MQHKLHMCTLPSLLGHSIPTNTRIKSCQSNSKPAQKLVYLQDTKKLHEFKTGICTIELWYVQVELPLRQLPDGLHKSIDGNHVNGYYIQIVHSMQAYARNLMLWKKPFYFTLILRSRGVFF